MEKVAHHGRETAYRHVAAGTDSPPVVFVHGSGGTHLAWANQYGRRDAPYSSVALDLSGHGDSDDVSTDPGRETLSAYAADVLAVARETGAEYLVGNSLGGAVALWIALEHDHPFEGLVLAGTGAKLAVLDSLREWLADDFERAIEFLHGEDRLFHDPDPEMVDRSARLMRETGRRVTRRDYLTCHSFDVRNRLEEVTTPALAVVGEYDGLTPPAYHEYLAEHLPDADYREISDAAHLAMVEHPAAFDRHLDAFV
jgi:pimeloyl-ACP methyl ester carboxylesterase